MLAVHRVTIPSSKFSSLKMCHNIAKVALGRTYELNTILLPLARANDTSGSLIRMRAWSSRNFMTCKEANKEKSAYFSRVSFGEILRKFVNLMI